MTDPIPVTLLTGILGAGKTTLLTRLLHDPSAGRVAAVVSRFGEAGLDHDLTEEAEEDLVLMPPRARGELAFDRVLVETTGLADQDGIHHTRPVDPVPAPTDALDGIVTAVDAVLGASALDRHGEAQAQVAMADRIVLIKCDLADAATIKAPMARLGRLNPGAQRITAGKGAVQLILSPWLDHFRRFQPSCSAYPIEALETRSPLRDLWLTVHRLDRCNPWGGSGHDPVPPRPATP